MKIGFIGLGRMGSAMAANLVKAGHDVTVFNRSPEKRRALLELGAHEALQVADACRGDAVITMLADDTAVAQVALADDGIVGKLRRGALHVSMSTISVALSKKLAQAHAQAGQRFVAAPVFGRPDAAAAAKLFIVAAGDPPAVEACKPLFDALGQKTVAIGGSRRRQISSSSAGISCLPPPSRRWARPLRSLGRPASIGVPTWTCSPRPSSPCRLTRPTVA